MSKRMNIIDFQYYILQIVKFFEFERKSAVWTKIVGDVSLEQLGELSPVSQTEKNTKNQRKRQE